MNSTDGAGILAGINLKNFVQIPPSQLKSEQQVYANALDNDAQPHPTLSVAQSSKLRTESQLQEIFKIKSNSHTDLSANVKSKKTCISSSKDEQSELSLSTAAGGNKAAANKGKMGRWTSEEKERFI